MSPTLLALFLATNGYGFGPGVGILGSIEPGPAFLEARVTSERKTFAESGFTYRVRVGGTAGTAGTVGTAGTAGRFVGGVEIAGYETERFGKRAVRAFGGVRLEHVEIIGNTSPSVEVRVAMGVLRACFGVGRHGLWSGVGIGLPR